jgi:LysM repeat protein
MRFRILGAIGALALFAPAAASAAFPHVVAPGESLYSVAAADGLSVDQLAAQNGLSADSELVAGSTLLIPPQSAAVVGSGVGVSSTPVVATTSSTTGTGGYVVQPGDSLWAVASRSGISVDALAAANGLDPNGYLISGSSISIPGASSSGATMVSTIPSSTAPAVVSSNAASGGPYPTPERVSASEVGSIGSANGVPSSLADAVGWQESGFNNDLVSSADARGVMQILPKTWSWIERSLDTGTPLAPASALDNVRGGVLLLRSLLIATDGNMALAAAGYIQGLASVRTRGMYPVTRQYVSDVLALRQMFGG